MKIFSPASVGLFLLCFGEIKKEYGITKKPACRPTGSLILYKEKIRIFDGQAFSA